MTAFRPGFLPLLGSLALLCTVAFAEPTATLEQDMARDYAAVVGPGQWFDLLVTVDPKGTPVVADGLAAALEAPAGAESGALIVPAPDKDGTFTKAFVLRLPVRLAEGGKQEARVKVTGRTADGPLALTAAKNLFVVKAADLHHHVQATVKLKEEAKVGQPNAVVVDGTVIEGYHVYGKDQDLGYALVGMLVPAPGTRGLPPWQGGGRTSPAGAELHALRFEIPFTPTRAGKAELRVLLAWQACTEEYCDNGEIDYLPLAFDVKEGTGVVERIPDVTPPPPPAAASDSGGEGLEHKSLLQLILLSIGAGIFALLMPCTYPLIPITISFFSKQAEARHGKVLPLALAYGAGIVLIFTAIGFVVGQGFARAESFSDLSNNAWINGIFAALFLLFGLSLIGLFDIRLPSWFDNVAAKASGSGGYLSVVVMGTTLVITSFTCTAPFIGTLLVYAGKGGDWARATLAMAVFGLTMGIPFVILSLSPKGIQALPRSGEWMKRLKVTLGIIELGLVLKFLSNVDIAIGTFRIGRELFLVLWSVSFLVSALYLLGAFDLLRKGATWSLTKGRAVFGILLLALTGWLLSGAGGTRLNKYVEAFLPSFQGHYQDGFAATVDNYEEGIRRARELGVNVFLHFTGYQ